VRSSRFHKLKKIISNIYNLILLKKINFNNKKAIVVICIIYFFCIGLVTFYSLKKPEYNWDMLPYMALVLKMEHKNIDEMHSLTYESAKQNIPAEAYQKIIDSTNIYRKKMKDSAANFYQQLPFYIIKPLYVLTVFAFYKIGFSLPASTILPSVFSYLFIAMFSLYWLKNYLNFFLAAVISLLVMLSAPMLTVARMSTPDCLSAFLLLSAFYFIIHKPVFIIAFIFLAISVFARLDNIIAFAAIIFLFIFSNKKEFKFSLPRNMIILLLLATCYFCVTSSVQGFGWSMLYYPSFVHYLNLLRGFHASFSIHDYLKIIYSNAVTGLYHAHIIVFFLMNVLIFCKKKIEGFSLLNFDQLFALIMMVVIVIRFLLQPDISDRFYIAYYLITIILLVRAITNNDDLNNLPKIFNQQK